MPQLPVDGGFRLSGTRQGGILPRAIEKLASPVTRFHKRIALKFITLPAIFSIWSAVAVWKY
jgi:hypothetical protein